MIGAVKAFFVDNPGEAKILILTSMLILYIVMMQWIGFFVSTFLLVILASRLMEAKGWVRPIALSVGGLSLLLFPLRGLDQIVLSEGHPVLREACLSVRPGYPILSADHTATRQRDRLLCRRADRHRDRCVAGSGSCGGHGAGSSLTLKLGPTAGLIMLAGIYYGSMYGGSTASILVNVPGEPASVVTTLDGYAMAKKGRAGAALAVSAIGFFAAGTFSVIALQFFAPLLARTALAFGPAEYFSLTVLGVVLLSNLTGKSKSRSLIMMVAGLILSTVGTDPIGGLDRFSFGIETAQGGLSFIAITTGLFGIAEVFEVLAARKKPMEILPVKFRELYPSRDEMRRSAAPIARGSVLGFLIGLLPGPAATMASFASYGMERSISKHPEKFGNGAIEGVAGPEAANNAASGGAMVPLLSLGLPFTPATAVLLGGMLLHGITPGPFLLRDRPDVFWGVIGSFYLGNAMLLILNLPLVGIFAKLVRVPSRYLMPVILVLCTIGT